MRNTPKQDKYYSVYRNRHSRVHHLAYIRLAKVLALLYALEQHNLSLWDKSIFDYGFGTGTFFHYCPKRSALFGVELDSTNVGSVKEYLSKKSYAHVDLRVINERQWRDHELLTRQYDLVIASHVLEHLREPVELLARLLSCLTPEGYLLGALPINELVSHENHEWVVDKGLIEEWAGVARAQIIEYWELDRFTFCALPVFNKKSALGRLLSQATSLGLGVPAALLGRRLWFKLDNLLGKITRIKPAQAVFLMRPL